MLQAEDPLPEGAPEEGAGRAARDAREAAFDAALAEAAARVQPAYREADGWLEQTRSGLSELLRFCDERPEVARGLVVDSIAWGPGVLERRGRLLDVLAGALDRGRAEEGIANGHPHSAAPAIDTAATSSALAQGPAAARSSSAGPPADATVTSPPADSPGAALSPATAENLVGACISLVHTRLLEARDGSFLELAPSLMSMIVHPYIGPAAAKRELERPFAEAGIRGVEREPQGTVARVRERSY
ncbi:MAG TPA: hypothetical protein VIJ50_14755 [Solirubrobacteraceae bacterium]